jgi:hypothetical protein
LLLVPTQADGEDGTCANTAGGGLVVAVGVGVDDDVDDVANNDDGGVVVPAPANTVVVIVAAAAADDDDDAPDAAAAPVDRLPRPGENSDRDGDDAAPP